MAHPRVASFTPRHQNYHQEMANHTAQYAPHRHPKPIEIPSSSSSSHNPLPPDAAWSNFYSSRHFSPRTASQSLPSDPSDNLETPTSSTLGFDANTIGTYQPEVSMPEGQQYTYNPTSAWRQSEGHQYSNPYRSQPYEPRSTSLSSPYTLPNWAPGLNPYARQSLSHQPDFSALPIPSFLPTPSHLDPGQPTMGSSYSYGYAGSSSTRQEGPNSLGLGFAPGNMAERNTGTASYGQQRSYQDGTYDTSQFRGASRQPAYVMPNTSAFRHNHSLSPPLSPIGANYVYEHGLMRVFANEAPDMYNAAHPLSGAGPPSAILPAVSAPDMTHSSPQSPAGQSPTPPTPFAPQSPYSMSPTYDAQPSYSFRNYTQDLGQGAESAPRAHKSPAKGKKGRKRFAAKPGDYSAEWESVTDKKERRRTQNRLAQRAFRARTRDQHQAVHAGGSGSAK